MTNPAHDPSTAILPPDSGTPTGARLVADDGRLIPLRDCRLEADAAGGIARTVLRQTFRNPHAEPLQVTYMLPLPADGAVGGYAFTIAGVRVVGEIDRVQTARERFASAVAEGRTASMLEETRASVFTQHVGNLPPGAEIECETVIDHPLAWEDDGWIWRFPTVVAPRYPGAADGDGDGDGGAGGGDAAGGGDTAMTVDVRVPEPGSESGAEAADSTAGPRMSLELRIADGCGRSEEAATSHTHELVEDPETRTVRLAAREGVRLDRDIAIHWAVGLRDAGFVVEAARPADGPASEGAYGLLSITPPAIDPNDPPPTLRRHVRLLIDTSGSMHGRTLDLAKELAEVVVTGLGPTDRLEMIEFSNRPRAWSKRPAPVTPECEERALAWIAGLEARGGTEMSTGVREALAPADSDALVQVILLTDGLVSFEADVVREALAARDRGCRVHAVGIGAAPNRSLTTAVARASGGTELIIDLDEHWSTSGWKLASRINGPLLSDLRVEGSAMAGFASATDPGASGETSRGLVPSASEVLAEGPLLVPVRLRPEGGRLTVRGRTDGAIWHRTVEVPPIERGAGRDAVPRLFARERVAALEVAGVLDGAKAVDPLIEETGLQFGIATRRTTWIAVTDEATVDPRHATRRARVPQELPQGMSMSAFAWIDDPATRGRGDDQVMGFAAPSANLRPRGFVQADRAAIGEMRSLSPSPSPRARFSAFVEGPLAGGSDETDRPEPTRGSLDARLIVRDEDHLVFEVTVDREIEWDPGVISSLLPFGRSLKVDPDRTTEPGTYGPGHVLRLTVRLASVRDRSFAARLAAGQKIRLNGRTRSHITLMILEVLPA